MLVFILISSIWLFISVRVVDLASLSAVNDYFPIEGTDYAVRYSSILPSGIYQGSKNTGVLMLEGRFGFDWGAVEEDGLLYLNEYRQTRFGLLFCDLVCVDTDGFEKKPLMKDAMLRGRCASGELVCVGGFLTPSNYPETNPLCRLYSVASTELRPGGESLTVYYFDPASGDFVYSLRDDAVSEDFDERYIERTLAEVMG